MYDFESARKYTISYHKNLSNEIEATAYDVQHAKSACNNFFFKTIPSHGERTGKILEWLQ